MNSYKKRFYFKNNNIFEAEFDSDATLEELEKYYNKMLKRGKIITERTLDEEINIINFKYVQTIRIEKIDN